VLSQNEFAKIKREKAKGRGISSYNVWDNSGVTQEAALPLPLDYWSIIQI